MSWIAVGVIGGTALVSGVGKKISSDNLAKQQRDAANNLQESSFISPALQEALGNAQKRQGATMYAGQDVDQANIQRSANNAFTNVARSTTSGTNLANSALAIQGQQNLANQGIQKNLAQYKDKANQDFTSLLLQKANAQQGNHNQYLAAKSALQGAAIQNKFQGNQALWNGVSQAGQGVVTGLYGGGGGGYGGAARGGYPSSYFSGISDSNPYADQALS